MSNRKQRSPRLCPLPNRSYGVEFPNPGSRVAMLDEALTVIRRLWTEESVSFAGRFFTLDDARCEPKAVQRPHPPIVIGGGQPKMLRVIAGHANEWNLDRLTGRVGQGQHPPR